MGPGSAALLALSLFAQVPAVGGVDVRPHLVPGSLLVRLRAPATLPALPHTARVQRVLTGGVLQLAVDDPDAVAPLVSRLRGQPEVVWAEPEHFRYAQQVPVDDPRYPAQWALPLMHLPAAWQLTQGSPGVVVAVIDTGVRPHPELAARLLRGYDFISDAASAGDGDGRDANATDEGALALGSSGLHGLHIAGIIGAQANNQTGIAGIDWNCRLLPVRVLGVHNAGGRDGDIADAIRWAAGLPVEGVADNQTPAQIINMSFGGPGGSQLLQEAVTAAVAHGAVVIASAGNDATDAATYAPAGLDEVLAVGAADDLGALTGYSNFGPRIALLAPGGGRTDLPESGILSTMYLPGQSMPWDYFFQAGTSQAAAQVTGVAALLWAMAPQLPPMQLRQLLTTTADARAQCMQGCGAGLIDAAAAVAATAAQAGCSPQCTLHEQCLDHTCVAITPLETPPGCGCHTTPGRSTPWGLGLLLLFLLGGLRRHQRHRLRR